jgi:hypothetical protein
MLQPERRNINIRAIIFVINYLLFSFFFMSARISSDLLSDVITKEIMSINKRLMLSSMFNLTWPNYSNGKTFEISNNYSDYQITSDTMLSKNSWVMNRFSIIQRTVFILSIVS